MTESAVLFLHAQTSLHPGSGTALGVVDLPVQRERHTRWPTIPGSTLKGVLRDACRERAAGALGGGKGASGTGSRREADGDPELTAAFGPPTAEAAKHAGALSVTDARLLAFPVRSLRGVFAWVTCAPVLERLARDLDLAGWSGLSDIPSPGKERAACAASGPLLVGDGEDEIVLEEFQFTRSGDATAVADWIAHHAVADEATAKRLRTHLAVLHEDDFTHFVCHATEVVARVGLSYDTKTVRTGALFYQELLPAETLLYSLIFASQSRRPGDATSAAQILEYLESRMPRHLQVGGDETTGKGLCAARLQRKGGV